MSGKSGVLTYREIAELLDVSPQTVQNIEFRALRKLRKLLAARGVVDPNEMRNDETTPWKLLGRRERGR